MQQTRISTILYLILSLLAFTSCTDEKAAINAVLDARDKAVSEHDIQSYHLLLIPGYEHKGISEFDAVTRMNRLFDQFEETEMQSSNRVIRLLEDNRAECEQSYLLRVKADDNWRQLYQRERIALTKTSRGWKISGGL